MQIRLFYQLIRHPIWLRSHAVAEGVVAKVWERTYDRAN
jgi:hypothetical protein